VGRCTRNEFWAVSLTARIISRMHDVINSALIIGACTIAFLAVSGQASIASVHGTSMAPNLHEGQLGVIWRSSHYTAGDVVGYHATWSGHDRVLHRVRAVGPGETLIMRGDANQADDPQIVHRSDAIGRLAFILPFDAAGARVLGFGTVALCIALTLLSWIAGWVAARARGIQAPAA
jgi:signal peptidase I